MQRTCKNLKTGYRITIETGVLVLHVCAVLQAPFKSLALGIQAQGLGVRVSGVRGVRIGVMQLCCAVV